MMKTCVIIGGGLGGLFCGALLAKNGIKVTVLEKNTIIGGGLQCFKRNKVFFETGMHTLGGFLPGGTLYQICDYLGILDRLSIQHLDPNCVDEIRIKEGSQCYTLPSGKERFIKTLIKYFPHEEEGIRSYVEEIFKLTEEIPLFYLKEDRPLLVSHSQKFFWSVDRLISHYIKDVNLRNLLAYMSPLYGGIKGETPAYVHALINVFYLNGVSRFIGGSMQLTNALKEIIESNGGKVMNKSEVKYIDITSSLINFIETSDSKKYSADYYVSAISPTALLNIVKPGALGKLYEKRISEIPVSYSAFSVFIEFFPKTFKFFNHTGHYHSNFEDIWGPNKRNNNNFIGSLYFITPPDHRNQSYANRMIVISVMNFDEVSKWADSKVGKRPKDYYKWKDEKTKQILNILEELYPGFKQCVKNIEAGSPLTIRDFYNSKEGSLYGFRKDCEDIFQSQISVKTKIKNLFLTGQNIILHGICGVPLTAIITAESILGENIILNQLNKNEN